MLPQETRTGAEGPPNPPRPWRWRKWLIVGAVVLAVFAILIALGDFESDSAIMLKDRSAFQNRVSAVVNALPSVVRDPLRKLKYRLFGPPKLFIVETLVVHFSSAPSFPGATALDVRGAVQSPGSGESNEPAPQFLVLPVTNSAAFRKQLGDVPGARVISSQQMHVFSGHGAQAATLRNPSRGIFEGFTIEVLPRVRQDSTDVALHAETLTPVSSETGQFVGTKTNVLVSARLNLQRHAGLLVLPGGSTGASTGIFVLPSLFHSKK